MSGRFVFALSALVGIVLTRTASAEVDFNKDIRPILENTCLKCHSEEKVKAGLRLDSKDNLLKGSKKGLVVTPGKADESLLYKLVAAEKTAKDRMPPEGEMLTKVQIEAIRNWINEGMKWPDGLVLKSLEPKGSAEDVGLPITPAEKTAVEKLQKQGVLAMRLAQSTNLLRVDFTHQKEAVKDENLALLKDMTNLVELNLGGTRITDKEMAHLRPLANLSYLVLHNTKITDAGLENLKGMPKLVSLNLYGDVDITDKGLEQLKGLANLRRLYVWQTKITKEAAKALADTVPGLVINLGPEGDVYKGKVEPPKVEGSGSASGSGSGSASGSPKPAGSGSGSASGSASGSPKPAGSGSGSASGSASGSPKPTGSGSASSSGPAKPAGSASVSGSTAKPAGSGSIQP
jgi:hypothetical protein